MKRLRVGMLAALTLAILIGGSLLHAPPALADGGPHRFQMSNYDVVTGQTETFKVGALGGCAMYHIVPGWSNWQSMGGCIRGGYGFDVGRNADNRYELFAIGYDDHVYHDWQTRPGLGPWSGWYPFGGTVAGNLGVASDPGGAATNSAGGRITVTVTGTNYRYWSRRQLCNGGCWSAWYQD